jgi:hypothetical protein
MTRSPYGPAFGRTSDSGPADAASELETDVMRFLAILALCLVAIFALVKSLPFGPSPAPAEIDAPAPAEIDAPAPLPVPAAKTPAVAAIERPKQQAPRAEPPAAAPAPRNRAAPTAPAATTVEPVTPAAAKGFVLQFESDRALTRLVERDAVGLYALSAGSAHRLKAEAGRMSFWPAAVPQAFHEMDPATVPAEVRRALAAAGVADSPAQWGVTLPPATSAELARHLRVAQGGTLIIDARGELRLEP